MSFWKKFFWRRRIGKTVTYVKSLRDAHPTWRQRTASTDDAWEAALEFTSLSAKILKATLRERFIIHKMFDDQWNGSVDKPEEGIDGPNE